MNDICSAKDETSISIGKDICLLGIGSSNLHLKNVNITMLLVWMLDQNKELEHDQICLGRHFGTQMVEIVKLYFIFLCSPYLYKVFK